MDTNVVVFLADGFEEIEALTVVDVLRRAEISVNTVSISPNKEVLAGHDVKVIADKLLADVNFDMVDLIVLPGGKVGTENLRNSKEVTNLVLEFHKNNKKIAAICAAPTILGQLGILKNRPTTCYPGLESQLTDSLPSNENVVVSDNIITSKMASTSLEFAFKIAEILKGVECACMLRKSM